MVDFRKLLMWALLACSITLAQAAPVLQVDSAGKLTGATGVRVGDKFYNVRFEDGSFNSLFSGGVFDLNSSEEVFAASNALLDQVFVGEFDTDTSLTVGCSININCFVATPFRIRGFEDVFGWYAANNYNTVPDYVYEIGWSKGADFATYTNVVYARWSIQPASTVPEPGTFLLIVVAMLGVLASRRAKSTSSNGSSWCKRATRDLGCNGT